MCQGIKFADLEFPSDADGEEAGGFALQFEVTIEVIEIAIYIGSGRKL